MRNAVQLLVVIMAAMTTIMLPNNNNSPTTVTAFVVVPNAKLPGRPPSIKTKTIPNIESVHSIPFHIIGGGRWSSSNCWWSSSSSTTPLFVAATASHNDDNDDHHNETNDDEQDLLESEITAAQDAHDCNDAGMEAAAEERAVMMAHELLQSLPAFSKKQPPSAAAPAAAATKSKQHQTKDPHLVHSIDQIHTESDEDLLESEIAAAQDAHDCNDAGMEAAAEERAVMMAHELLQNLPSKRENP